MKERECPKRTEHQKILDRLEQLEHRQRLLWDSVFLAVKYETDKSGKDKKTVLLKGRVDILEEMSHSH